jgi:hypothetical protein
MYPIYTRVRYIILPQLLRYFKIVQLTYSGFLVGVQQKIVVGKAMYTALESVKEKEREGIKDISKERYSQAQTVRGRG